VKGKCGLCKEGETQFGRVTVTLQRGDTIVIIKQAPADICDNCGKHYLSREVTSQVLQKGENAVKKRAEVEILRYAA
jgi:YgiT-type zinc finger domain-containing protein